MLRAVLGDLVQTTDGKWITRQLVAARTVTRSARIRSSSATSPASDTAAATRHGHAGRAIRRCTGRRPTRTAQRSMGLRQRGSQPRGTDAKLGQAGSPDCRRPNRGAQDRGCPRPVLVSKLDTTTVQFGHQNWTGLRHDDRDGAKGSGLASDGPRHYGTRRGGNPKYRKVLRKHLNWTPI